MIPYEEGQLRRSGAGVLYVVLRLLTPRAPGGSVRLNSTWLVAVSCSRDNVPQSDVCKWGEYAEDDLLSRP